ncbi:MAG: phosphoribosylformimino-5-aminoimidazole carboxamide ribotide isomerase [Clostridiales bacterium]|nr:phosphoribosylformimino-5-aminoimidazole carboxamide ribotide isomerase [Clostridiales bacterium]
MRFRPCIDIHNGCVKQIVGGSLSDKGNVAIDNFVSSLNGKYYAQLYRKYDLYGGHIIILNPEGSEYYEADVEQARLALEEFPQGLQIGGGINDKNALRFLDMGASHVIVTSFVFKNGEINHQNLKKISDLVGKNRLVIDLSCRKKDGEYYIVTDRWQKFTNIKLTQETIDYFSSFCDEFLIHAVDSEGKASGIETKVAELMGNYCKITSTYAGGISSMKDLDVLRKKGKNKLDFTIGSALDIFGGNIPFETVAKIR